MKHVKKKSCFWWCCHSEAHGTECNGMCKSVFLDSYQEVCLLDCVLSYHMPFSGKHGVKIKSKLDITPSETPGYIKSRVFT